MRTFMTSIGLALVMTGAIALVSNDAFAHNTENERRRPAACNSIAGDAERAACKICVANANRHYHPRDEHLPP